MPGIFDMQKAGSIPAPVGFEINEGEGIAYLGSVFDKWSMRRDRMNIYKDVNKAIKYVKNELENCIFPFSCFIFLGSSSSMPRQE